MGESGPPEDPWVKRMVKPITMNPAKYSDYIVKGKVLMHHIWTRRKLTEHINDEEGWKVWVSRGEGQALLQAYYDSESAGLMGIYKTYTAFLGNTIGLKCFVILPGM